MKRIENIREFIENSVNKMEILKEGNVLKNSFIRNRKLTFRDLLLICIAWKGRSTTMELFDFYKKAEKGAVSKQDFSKQRMKIMENFWIESLREVALIFYNDYDYKTLDEYLVLAIDGSKTILPRCKELEEIYGLANADEGQQKCVQCLISGCYDVLNNIMLNIQIAPYASDERELAKKNIEEVRKMFPNKKILIIFDRGYPSIDMMNFIEENGLCYLIRMQNSTYEKEKKKMKSNDEKVYIELNKDRLTGKMSEETRNKLKERKIFETRFIKCELSSKTTEWLVTNLDKEKYSEEDLKELYFKRWGIEVCYNTLKNKLEIENISGKCDLIVRQDIYATIIVYNMIEVVNFLIEEDEEVEEILKNPKNKYEYKINENILIGAFKDLFVELIITENKKKKKQLYELLYQNALRNKTAIIPNRSYKREFKKGSKKCKVNYKRAF